MNVQDNNGYGASYPPPYPLSNGGSGNVGAPQGYGAQNEPYYGAYQTASPMGPTSTYLSRPSLTPLESCEGFFRNYAKFDGRASRSEYWWPVLGNLIISSVLSTLSGGGENPHGALATIASAMGTAFSLAVLVPSLSVGARRLHDTDRSGWWQLLWLIPIFGWIPLIIWLCQGSNPMGARHDGPRQPWVPNSVAPDLNGPGSSFFRGQSGSQQLGGSMSPYGGYESGSGASYGDAGYVDSNASGQTQGVPTNLSKGQNYGTPGYVAGENVYPPYHGDAQGNAPRGW